MNIKDVARLAGVSPSTVSKIINGKNESISAETCEKVLQIVKECNYIPYEAVRTTRTARSFLLGALITQMEEHHAFFKSMMESARAQGYSIVFCTARNKEEEYKGLSSLLHHQVDGIIWEQGPDSDTHCENLLRSSDIPVIRINQEAEASWENSVFDYKRLGYQATEALLCFKHRNVICLVGGETGKDRLFRAGYEQCMYDNKVPAEHVACRAVLAVDEEQGELIPFGTTGAVCSTSWIALKVSQQAQRTNRRIPKYLSVVYLDDTQGQALQELSSIRLPYEELAQYVVRRLIHNVESGQTKGEAFRAEYSINHRDSIDVPIHVRNKKIVVVGTLNMDTLISVESFPYTGETSRALRRSIMPGGKGVNQSICAAKLGADVYLIGKIGKDYDGSRLFTFMQQNGVNTEGLFSTARADSGQAYIYVQEGGESGIVIYDGANRCLKCDEIMRMEHLFENASFCLLQTEMSVQIVMCAAQLAKKHGCKVLLKPSVLTQLEPELLGFVDILLPNEREINVLCPDKSSLEEKAQCFLDQGVDTVIITLGSKGGYVRNKELSEYFAAADFVPVDTTGAADVFCSTLAVYLSQSCDLRNSIRYANVAAGYSTTHYGAAPSITIDKSMLDFLAQKDGCS